LTFKNKGLERGMSADSEKSRTVRELGGDIFAAIAASQDNPEYWALKQVDFAGQKMLVELTMRVLAQHVGTTISQDAALPVKPLDEGPV